MHFDWESPRLLLLALPALALLLWAEAKSVHPMSALRKRLLLVIRAAGVLVLLLALAGPARVVPSDRVSAVLLLDHSQSMGAEGLSAVMAQAKALREAQPNIEWQQVAIGEEPLLLTPTSDEGSIDWMKKHGQQTHYEKAIQFAKGLFPPGAQREIILVGDGNETRGSLLLAARQASANGIRLSAIPVAGKRQRDVRISALTPSQPLVHEGASLSLTATVECTAEDKGQVNLYENGIKVGSGDITVNPGTPSVVRFERSPPQRNLFRYRAVLEGFSGDQLPANDSALALVEVRGQMRLLLCDSDPAEVTQFAEAMSREGIKLDIRGPGQIPKTLGELSGYDGIILSDIPARALGDDGMTAMKAYVEQLGGGLIMTGGPNSFGLGGYYKSPLEETLPVRLKAPDEEEKQSSALAIVMDRSGSMAGDKLETAKAAAIAAAEVLGRNDSIGVYAFDSETHVVTPMTRVTSLASIRGQIATLASGGGTNLEPTLRQAREALQRARAKIKHMIILTDGQTAGSGYEGIASQCRAEGITISTVGIGEGSHVGLLQAIAYAGGGQAYLTQDVASITRIFTQDTLMHTGQILREDPTDAVISEKHAMLNGLIPWSSPTLLGYVKTVRKASAQLPLVTDSGDPLLATWHYGAGKVTAFTSDLKSRWSGLWISRWGGFSAFWAQVLRETALAPQGQRMSATLELEGENAQLTVDVLTDAMTRANGATVEAEVLFLPVNSLGGSFHKIKQLILSQENAGEYVGHFRPDQAGVYMVRAQEGTDNVSTSLIHQPSAEASLDTINEAVLTTAVKASGGQILAHGQTFSQKYGHPVTENLELWPLLAQLAIICWLFDIGIRRWEHLLSMKKWILARSETVN